MGFLVWSKNWGKFRVEGRSPQLEIIPYFIFKLIFFAKSQSLWPLLFSKQLLIHGIVNNSVCERLGEDWHHKIVIKNKCFRVAKSGAFKFLFADFNFL